MALAVLDACVLFPAYLRDSLLRLAAAGLYQPLWSDAILDELEANLGELTGRESAARVVELMREHFPDAPVTGFEPLVTAMTNHPKDRHVLAAAVRSNAAAVVTFNLSDFPTTAAEQFGVDVIDPDRFLTDLLDLAPGLFMSTMRRQVEGYAKPQMTVADLARALARSNCEGAAAQIALHLEGRRGGPAS